MEAKKIENAMESKVVIMGLACVVKSSMTLEELRHIRDNYPELLEMHDEKNEVIFTLELDEDGPGSLEKDGAVFSRATTADGKATMTILLDPEAADDRLALVRKLLGLPLQRLMQMEEKIAEQLPEVEKDRAEVLANISLV